MYYLSILHDIIWAHVSMYGRVLEVGSSLRDYKQYQQSQCYATSIAQTAYHDGAMWHERRRK